MNAQIVLIMEDSLNTGIGSRYLRCQLINSNDRIVLVR